jgi:ABC-type transport system substrate-binding protein
MVGALPSLDERTLVNGRADRRSGRGGLAGTSRQADAKGAGWVMIIRRAMGCLRDGNPSKEPSSESHGSTMKVQRSPRPRTRRGRLPLRGLLLTVSLVVVACGDDESASDGAAGGEVSAVGSTAAESTSSSVETDPSGSAADNDVPSTAEENGGEPQRGGMLRAAWGYNPSSLDPHVGSAGSDHVSLYPLYDTLITFNPETLVPEPGLATSWEFIQEPPALVLTLEQGVTFHDGTPFDAAAVEYNINRVKTLETSPIKQVLSSVDNAEVLAPNEVRLNLNRMDTSLPLILADRAGMMVSPTAAEALGPELGMQPVGTGPFRFVEFRPDDRLVVERHDAYWRGGLPYLDGITIQYMLEPQTQINALQSDQVDFLLGVPGPELERVEQLPGVSATQHAGLAFDHCQFNTMKPPFDDVRVREAFNLAIDRESMLQNLAFGLGEVAWQAVPSGHWAYQEDLSPTYEYNPERARELLAEAGYADGVSVSGLGLIGEANARKMEIVQAQLAEVGVDIDVELLEVAVATDSFYADAAYDVYCPAWSGRPDPSQTVSELFTDEAFYMVGPTGVGEEMTRLLAEATSVQDVEERAAAFNEIMSLVYENSLHAPLFYAASIQAFQDDVHGYVPNLYGKPQLNEVWMEQ